jgi:hypothetical protein
MARSNRRSAVGKKALSGQLSAVSHVTSSSALMLKDDEILRQIKELRGVHTSLSDTALHSFNKICSMADR